MLDQVSDKIRALEKEQGTALKLSSLQLETLPSSLAA